MHMAYLTPTIDNKKKQEKKIDWTIMNFKYMTLMQNCKSHTYLDIINNSHASYMVSYIQKTR